MQRERSEMWVQQVQRSAPDIAWLVRAQLAFVRNEKDKK
jgi:hypothetical protein